MNAQDLADAVKGVVSDSTSDSEATRFFNVCSSVGTSLGLFWFIDSGTPVSAGAMIIRSVITKRLSRISEVFSLAASRGYVLPDDPSPIIGSLNSMRQLWQPIGILESDALNIATNAVELSRTVDALDKGEISFDRPKPSAQFSSFEVSVDGISSQSGDALADILGYQPDGDFVKRKRALDSLSKLDFSKRKPYLLFTADVIYGGKRTGGTIICWMRMRDASGFVISKRDVFAGSDMPDIVLSNASLEDSTAKLTSQNEFHQLISLYDWVHAGDFFAFKDDSTSPNTLYSLSVMGVQRKARGTLSLFDVPVSDLYLSTGQAADARTLIEEELKGFLKGLDDNSVSPYPAISQVIYGDPGYGWILAGCNVLASKRRGESADQIRSFSFIGSKVDDILAAAASGKIVAPNDISEIHSAVDASVQSFGVSQTILSVLDGTGSTLFISGKDDPTGLHAPTQDSLEKASGGLAKILSVIDPESATIDPSKLSSALAVQAAGVSGVKYVARLMRVSTGSTVPDLSTVIGTGVIDMTAYDGISRFMSLVRSVYDFYPGSLT